MFNIWSTKVVLASVLNPEKYLENNRKNFKNNFKDNV